jgi:fructose-bisphosphate aldolase, class II
VFRFPALPGLFVFEMSRHCIRKYRQYVRLIVLLLPFRLNRYVEEIGTARSQPLSGRGERVCDCELCGGDMRDIREVLELARKDKVALGHFNVSDLVLLKAVFSSAQELEVPVLVGASEGEREFMGVHQIAALVRSFRDEFDFPVFLNADHTHTLKKAIEAAKAGFDSVVFDVSALPFEQNVRQTKEAVEALKTINPAILVEGEIGNIGTGSEIHELAADLSKYLTTPTEAKQFVEFTGVDVLAPAVGNMHGMSRKMVEGEKKKRLDIERIAQIEAAARVPLTLHGGSGTDDGDLVRAIAAGISVIHINTELRVAWRNSLEAGLTAQPNQVVPYKILPSAVESVKQVVLARLRLFNHLTQPVVEEKVGVGSTQRERQTVS